MPLIKYGHCDFGENKVQEAQKKWPKLKELNSRPYCNSSCGKCLKLLVNENQ